MVSAVIPAADACAGDLRKLVNDDVSSSDSIDVNSLA